MKTITLHRDDFRDDKLYVWEGLLHEAGVGKKEYDKFCSVEISARDMEVVAYLKEEEAINEKTE